MKIITQNRKGQPVSRNLLYNKLSKYLHISATWTFKSLKHLKMLSMVCLSSLYLLKAQSKSNEHAVLTVLRPS